jgi:hypothetical protein
MSRQKTQRQTVTIRQALHAVSFLAIFGADKITAKGKTTAPKIPTLDMAGNPADGSGKYQPKQKRDRLCDAMQKRYRGHGAGDEGKKCSGMRLCDEVLYS